jgi:outer membrane biogenesis lipoprotein LolB
MRLLISALAVALLAGCSTPSDLKSGGATITATTAKQPKQYALCVMPKWQDARSGASMSETEKGYRLLVSTNTTAEELLEVNQSSGGSNVALYQRLSWAPGYGRAAIEKAVRDCL